MAGEGLCLPPQGASMEALCPLAVLRLSFLLPRSWGTPGRGQASHVPTTVPGIHTQGMLSVTMSPFRLCMQPLPPAVSVHITPGSGEGGPEARRGSAQPQNTPAWPRPRLLVSDFLDTKVQFYACGKATERVSLQELAPHQSSQAHLQGPSPTGNPFLAWL